MNAFISYSHKDEKYTDRLRVHLAQMRREGTISDWYDREISAGSNLDGVIRSNLDSSDIFIAITSPDFIASGYCYDEEMARAIEMHADGSITLIPLIVEPCDWINTPLQKFRATPRDGKPVSEWSNQNSAFLDVVEDLRRLAASRIKKPNAAAAPKKKTVAKNARPALYRTKKDFDRIDRIEFKKNAFEEIASTLESFCKEANEIDGIRALFERKPDGRFFVTLVNKNKSNAASERTVYISDDGFANGINILDGRSESSNSSNGGFSVNSDDYDLFLTSMFGFSDSRDRKLSPSDAANEIWTSMMKMVGIEHAD